MRNNTLLKKYLPGLLTICSLFFLFVRSFQYANMLPSRLDESLFLYKGYLFANGTYKPFEAYGLWTNKNPLSFLIPGWFQLIFGAGLRSGRILSILLGVLTVIAIWMVVKRETSDWLAFLASAAIAFNPFYAWTFSQFISQSLAAFFLAWTLVFILGKKRNFWQLMLGMLLAVLVVQVRQNMLPILPLLVIYIYWEHGKKAGTISLITGLAAFLFFTAIYWPDILRNYLAVIPAFIVPIVKNLIYIPDANRAPVTITQFLGRLHALAQGITAHFSEMLGVSLAGIIAGLNIKRKKYSEKMLFSLLLIYSLLFLIHLWASVLKNYCVYCFSNYLSFFGIIGVVLLAIGLYHVRIQNRTQFWNLITIILILTFCTAAGFSIHLDTGHFLMEMKVPRIKDMRFIPGTVELWTLLGNKFGLDYDQLEIIIPTVFGFLAGIIIILITFLWNKIRKNSQSFIYSSFLTTTILGSLLTFVCTEEQYSASYRDCSENIIDTYESVGKYLNDIIPSGSKVWWYSTTGQILLSYIDDIQIYPPQLNYTFNYLVGGTSNEIYKYGYWNEDLALHWLEDTDYAIIENPNFRGDIVKWIDTDKFEELAPTISISQCSPNDYFRVFRRR